MRKFNRIMNVAFVIVRQFIMVMFTINGIIAFAEEEVYCEGAFIMIMLAVVVLWAAKNTVNEVSNTIKDAKTAEDRK